MKKPAEAGFKRAGEALRSAPDTYPARTEASEALAPRLQMLTHRLAGEQADQGEQRAGLWRVVHGGRNWLEISGVDGENAVYIALDGKFFLLQFVFNSFIRHVKVTPFNFNADKLSVKSHARHAGATAAHKWINNRSVCEMRNNSFHKRNWLGAWVRR